MSTPPLAAAAPAPIVTQLANGARVLLLPMPALATASVAAFVRVGSEHEPRALNGICHVVEHMVFKGTRQRDARTINLDAERLGAEVDAHTDKDHTALRLRGLPGDVPEFVRLLGELVCEPAFPADELARETQVLRLESEDDADDPMSSAYKLFDRACFGTHAAAQAVIGSRTLAARLAPDTLRDWVAGHYSASNLVLAAAGPIDPDALLRQAEAAFGALPAGTPNLATAPAYLGDVAARPQSGSGQAHLVLGGAVAPRGDAEYAARLAAAVFGEGMASPLLHRLREELGIAYHATCAVDLLDASGQFVVEASTAAGQLDATVTAVMALLRGHADAVAPLDFERARRQLAVRLLVDDERSSQRLEDAALDLLALGRVRSRDERLDALHAVPRDAVRAVYAGLLQRGVSLAAVGAVGRAARTRLRALVAGG